MKLRFGCLREKTAGAAVILIGMLLGAGAAAEQNMPIEIGGLRAWLPIRTLKDLRDQSVVRQGYDYSCGAAALATLLTYGMDDPVSEKDLAIAMLETLNKDDEALRRKEGFSLLDMQRVSQLRGYEAQGFRLGPEAIEKVSDPVIVFITPRGYEHFAVLRGISNGRAYLADPSLGNVRMPLFRFFDMWLDASGNGIIFAIERRDNAKGPGGVLRLSHAPRVPPELLSAREMLEVRSGVSAPRSRP
jgi:predicted double-glycine peptidase